ncbi:MAG: hypothetical protein LBT38_01040, partial [Deltaproteobacteria bacterium]|nr:hypothetical protein [Deltaproteobacteria bacterium]
MDLNKLKYSTELVWARVDDGQATIGLTEEALRDYTELTKIRLIQEGEELSKDDILGQVFAGRGRGLKIIAPITGEVLAVNEDLLDAPDAILDDPYEEGWLIKQTVAIPLELSELMTRYEYEDFVEEELLEDDEDLEDDDEDFEDEDDFDEDDDDFFDDEDDD